MEKIYNSREEYDLDHECCPKCKSKKYQTTCLGIFFFEGKPFKDKNQVYCSCGWHGTVDDLTKG